MATKDTTTTLNSGTGGDVLDESNVLEASFTTGAAPASVGKRPRVVIGGQDERASLIEPLRDVSGFALPVVDVEARRMLAEMHASMARIEEMIAAYVTAALARS